MGRPLSLLVPPDKLSESIARRNAVFSGQNIAFETERLSKDEVARPMDQRPRSRSLRRSCHIAAIHRDISAQVRHETQLRFVMRELAHRTKNLLAIIQSIERQTSRGVVTTEEFHERFPSGCRPWRPPTTFLSKAIGAGLASAIWFSGSSPHSPIKSAIA